MRSHMGLKDQMRLKTHLELVESGWKEALSGGQKCFWLAATVPTFTKAHEEEAGNLTEWELTTIRDKGRLKTHGLSWYSEMFTSGLIYGRLGLFSLEDSLECL